MAKKYDIEAQVTLRFQITAEDEADAISFARDCIEHDVLMFGPWTDGYVATDYSDVKAEVVCECGDLDINDMVPCYYCLRRTYLSEKERKNDV